MEFLWNENVPFDGMKTFHLKKFLVLPSFTFDSESAVSHNSKSAKILDLAPLLATQQAIKVWEFDLFSHLLHSIFFLPPGSHVLMFSFSHGSHDVPYFTNILFSITSLILKISTNGKKYVVVGNKSPKKIPCSNGIFVE